MVCSKPPSEVTFANQSREEVMESKVQHLKTECTGRTKDSKEHHSDKAVISIAAQVSMKEMGFCPAEGKGPQGDTKTRKRKYSHKSATWGVALRKPSRERKKVRAYSPSRERTFRKKAKMGLDKGGKYKRNAVKKYKSKGGEVKKDFGESKENNIPAGNGDMSKCKTIPDATIDKLLISDPEGYSDELKSFMKEEIKRQILNGLGEACKSALIEAVEVEEIGRYTASSIHELKDSVPEDEHYMAKTKLTLTLLFPVTLRAGQGSPQGFHEPTEIDAPPASRLEPEVLENLHGSQRTGIEANKAEIIEGADDIKERESTGMFEDTKPEPRGLMEPDNREPELSGLMEPDNREPEPGGVLELEKFHDEPLFESESSEFDVPESEFYDFECDRNEDKFSPGQVWASYDSGRDVMPRDYVQIKRVMSVRPFKLEITLLEPRGFSDWVKAGNSLTCGEFSTENRLRGMDQIDGFSHMVNWEKGKNGMIHIYPVEREVWALYKDWKEFDPKRRIKLGYDIVQVVAIEKGDLTVSVVPLANFKGSRTVFVQQEVEPFKIPKTELFRFSHQIPTYEILDLEGSMELDPAATPY